MQGVITKKEVLKNPFIIIEGFGMRVFVKALFADKDATFLDIVTECGELEEHEYMEDLDFTEIVNRFIGYEIHAREAYATLSKKFKEYDDVSNFFRLLSKQEEGHAIVLSRVKREVKRGHYWKETKDDHRKEIESFEKLLKVAKEKVSGDISLADAFQLVENLEGSEINYVFNNLNESVDMKSRTRFEKFFVMSDEHVKFCERSIKAFREKYSIN